ncbi:hypothetical protein [Nocardioides nitrophenolicus]|uniref:hypothetical protein n=1 Tax=Nocardioides nitrophenolicus TaxID=60489 RepID=UPI00195C357A|nr:hypothetical protein [Nocardioides nitrophenolicus]MBM7518277.1 hypothetical protein [Nocardioides nitrophenolicus]
MTLAPLADPTDLPPAWADHEDAAKALAVASSAIRDAAEGPIAATTGTVTIDAPGGTKLALPGPIRAITAVTIDGRPVTDYRNLGDGLWRRGGWGDDHAPVAVTATFGLPEVPADIAELCVSLAVAWLEHRTAGASSTAGLTSVKIDDASETYTDEAASQITPVYIPELTRAWLRARFGGGVAVVETL